MVYSRLVVSFCSQAGNDYHIINTTVSAVHAKSTTQSVVASIEQGANRIALVADRLPCLSRASFYDKDDFSCHSQCLSGNGSEPAYAVPDVIRMAINFARDEV